MNVGSGLTVDGTISATQASQPGEAVMLDASGKIPSEFVQGGGMWELLGTCAQAESQYIKGDLYALASAWGIFTFIDGTGYKQGPTIEYFYLDFSNDVYFSSHSDGGHISIGAPGEEAAPEEDTARVYHRIQRGGLMTEFGGPISVSGTIKASQGTQEPELLICLNLAEAVA